ncbi:MAG: T9SS type A sorting domain-containing protein [Gemmatimonadetes bacterium]|nr:T9SS type A sorting domain-containing protein [Gemmatimonadota bacterium]
MYRCGRWASALFLLLCGAAATYAQGPPAWQVDPAGFENTMTVTAAVYVDGQRTDALGHLLAVFAGDEVRGVATPLLVEGQARYFLTVYGRSSGEVLTLKFYDASADEVRDVAQGLVYTANQIVGATATPFRFDVGTSPVLEDPGAWVVDPGAFESTMTITAAVWIDGQRVTTPEALLAAFVGNDPRGTTAGTVVARQAGDEVLFFLTIYADGVGETLAFRFYEPTIDSVFIFPETLAFEPNAVVGSPSDPLQIRLGIVTAIEPVPDGDTGEIDLRHYPEPFQEMTRIQYVLPEAAPVRLTVYDALGRQVRVLLQDHQGPGNHEILFDAIGLPSGLYVYRLQSGIRVAFRTMVLTR